MQCKAKQLYAAAEKTVHLRTYNYSTYSIILLRCGVSKFMIGKFKIHRGEYVPAYKQNYYSYF